MRVQPPEVIEALRVQRSCKSCGNDQRPDDRCGRCGGSGLLHSMYSGAVDCPACGYSGIQYPPVCPGCSKFRSWRGWR